MVSVSQEKLKKKIQKLEKARRKYETTQEESSI
jgi:hypothetical protein